MGLVRWAGIAAAVTAAAGCGDKITLPAPVRFTAPGPVTVNVSPSIATLNVGDAITLVAAVTADAGTPTTVTWASSDASKVTVDPAGKVTAVATTPGVAVCATATVDSGKKGCASIIVTASPVATPASVSIASITVSGNLNSTVNAAAVTGQIDIRVNVNPGNQTITKVVVQVGAVRADSQVFTSAESAALRSAADLAVAAQSTFPQILFSVNTAAYDAAGLPTWPNGPHSASAMVYTRAGGTATVATASAQANMIFANANTWFVAATVSGPSAADANGHIFERGSISVSATPVMYNGASLSSTVRPTITFGGNCDQLGARTIPLNPPVAGFGAWTTTFVKSAGASTESNFNSYEYRPAACPTYVGEGFALTATDTNGNRPFVGAPPTNDAANRFRIDNVPPPVPVTVVNPGGRANSWINDAVGFNADLVAATPVDVGIGDVTLSSRVGTTLATALASNDATDAASLPASVNNSAYCLVQYAVDLLGNKSADPGACAQTFGVDRAAPVLQYDNASLTANKRITGASIGGEFIVSAADTGSVGNSGLLLSAPVVASVLEKDAAGICGTVTAGVCAQSILAGAPAPLYTTAITGTTTAAYFTFAAFAYDNAGNFTVLASRTIVHDPVAPSITSAISLYASSYDGGVPQTFSAFAGDNLDVRDAVLAVQYGAIAVLERGSTVVNPFDAATLLSVNVPVTFADPFFIRQIQTVTGSGPVSVSAQQKPSSIVCIVHDQGNNESAPVSIALPASFVVTGSSSAYPGAGTQLMNAWGVTNTATNVSDGAGQAAPVNPTSVTMTADVLGATGTFNPPFARVDFFAQLASGRWTLIGTATGHSTNDNGSPTNGRRHRYSFTWTPGVAASYASNPVNVIAVGSTAQGDALMTVTNASITITNP